MAQELQTADPEHYYYFSLIQLYSKLDPLQLTEAPPPNNPREFYHPVTEGLPNPEGLRNNKSCKPKKK